MPRLVGVLPIFLLTIIILLGENQIGDYLILKGLIPKEKSLVSIFAVTSFLFGFLSGWIIWKLEPKLKAKKDQDLTKYS